MQTSAVETDERSTALDLPAVISRYAERFHELGGDKHHVASPLSAWMLLALCAPAATGRLRDELSDVLGVDAAIAGRLVAQLLSERPQAVATAAGVWIHENLPSAQAASFLDALPPSVARETRIPNQAELDEWVRKNTFGLIDSFPIQRNDAMTLLLADTLATKVKWRIPFELYPAVDLGPESRWSGRVKCVLQAVGGRDHVQFIATTQRAGDVAVHAAWATEGLLVASVIADSQVPSSAVLAAAHDIATRLVKEEPLQKRSLFDLPLGETAIWVIDERLVFAVGGADRVESYTTVLPAWEARNDYDLLRRDLGFTIAAATVAKAMRLPLLAADARQSVVAKYSRFGFEAAAVTALGMTGSAMPSPVRGRRARLRFAHPYAAVAVTAAERSGAAGVWHGVPVFSAWVTDITEAGDAPTGSEEQETAVMAWFESRRKRR